MSLVMETVPWLRSFSGGRGAKYRAMALPRGIEPLFQP